MTRYNNPIKPTPKSGAVYGKHSSALRADESRSSVTVSRRLLNPYLRLGRLPQLAELLCSGPLHAR